MPHAVEVIEPTTSPSCKARDERTAPDDYDSDATVKYTPEESQFPSPCRVKSERAVAGALTYGKTRLSNTDVHLGRRAPQPRDVVIPPNFSPPSTRRSATLTKRARSPSTPPPIMMTRGRRLAHPTYATVPQPRELQVPSTAEATAPPLHLDGPRVAAADAPSEHLLLEEMGSSLQIGEPQKSLVADRSSDAESARYPAFARATMDATVPLPLPCPALLVPGPCQDKVPSGHDRSQDSLLPGNTNQACVPVVPAMGTTPAEVRRSASGDPPVLAGPNSPTEQSPAQNVQQYFAEAQERHTTMEEQSTGRRRQALHTMPLPFIFEGPLKITCTQTPTQCAHAAIMLLNAMLQSRSSPAESDDLVPVSGILPQVCAQLQEDPGDIAPFLKASINIRQPYLCTLSTITMPVVAAALVHMHQDSSNVVIELDFLATSPKERCKGYARLLLAYLVAQARQSDSYALAIQLGSSHNIFYDCIGVQRLPNLCLPTRKKNRWLGFKTYDGTLNLGPDLMPSAKRVFARLLDIHGTAKVPAKGAHKGRGSQRKEPASACPPATGVKKPCTTGPPPDPARPMVAELEPPKCCRSGKESQGKRQRKRDHGQSGRTRASTAQKEPNPVMVPEESCQPISNAFADRAKRSAFQFPTGPSRQSFQLQVSSPASQSPVSLLPPRHEKRQLATPVGTHCRSFVSLVSPPVVLTPSPSLKSAALAVQATLTVPFRPVTCSTPLSQPKPCAATGSLSIPAALAGPAPSEPCKPAETYNVSQLSWIAQQAYAKKSVQARPVSGDVSLPKKKRVRAPQTALCLATTSTVCPPAAKRQKPQSQDLCGHTLPVHPGHQDVAVTMGPRVSPPSTAATFNSAMQDSFADETCKRTAATAVLLSVPGPAASSPPQAIEACTDQNDTTSPAGACTAELGSLILHHVSAQQDTVSQSLDWLKSQFQDQLNCYLQHQKRNLLGLQARQFLLQQQYGHLAQLCLQQDTDFSTLQAGQRAQQHVLLGAGLAVCGARCRQFSSVVPLPPLAGPATQVQIDLQPAIPLNHMTDHALSNQATAAPTEKSVPANDDSPMFSAPMRSLLGVSEGDTTPDSPCSYGSNPRSPTQPGSIDPLELALDDLAPECPWSMDADQMPTKENVTTNKKSWEYSFVPFIPQALPLVPIWGNTETDMEPTISCLTAQNREKDVLLMKHRIVDMHTSCEFDELSDDIVSALPDQILDIDLDTAVEQVRESFMKDPRYISAKCAALKWNSRTRGSMMEKMAALQDMWFRLHLVAPCSGLLQDAADLFDFHFRRGPMHVPPAHSIPQHGASSSSSSSSSWDEEFGKHSAKLKKDAQDEIEVHRNERIKACIRLLSHLPAQQVYDDFLSA
eukprot:gene4183-106_t